MCQLVGRSFHFYGKVPHEAHTQTRRLNFLNFVPFFVTSKHFSKKLKGTTKYYSYKMRVIQSVRVGSHKMVVLLCIEDNLLHHQLLLLLPSQALFKQKQQRGDNCNSKSTCTARSEDKWYLDISEYAMKGGRDRILGAWSTRNIAHSRGRRGEEVGQHNRVTTWTWKINLFTTFVCDTVKLEKFLPVSCVRPIGSFQAFMKTLQFKFSVSVR